MKIYGFSVKKKEKRKVMTTHGGILRSIILCFLLYNILFVFYLAKRKEGEGGCINLKIKMSGISKRKISATGSQKMLGSVISM